MEIISDKEEMIFRKDYKGIPKYTIGLSKKNKDNQYENGYMQVRFKKDVTLRNQTKIMIKSAWLGFNTYEKKTYPYIFINEFVVTDQGAMQETSGDEVPVEEMKTKTDVQQQFEYTEEDLPW